MTITNEEIKMRLHYATQALPVAAEKDTQWEAVPEKWLLLYACLNQLAAHIGMCGDIDSKHPVIDDLMNALHDIDDGIVYKRAMELHEKANMPLFDALNLAADECGNPSPIMQEDIPLSDEAKRFLVMQGEKP